MGHATSKHARVRLLLPPAKALAMAAAMDPAAAPEAKARAPPRLLATLAATSEAPPGEARPLMLLLPARLPVRLATRLPPGGGRRPGGQRPPKLAPVMGFRPITEQPQIGPKSTHT